MMYQIRIQLILAALLGSTLAAMEDPMAYKWEQGKTKSMAIETWQPVDLMKYKISTEEKGARNFIQAVSNNNLGVVLDFLNSGIPVNSQADLGETALHRAASLGLLDMVELLIAYGANVNAQDKKGRTPLINALLAGSKPTLDALLSAGARSEITDKTGRSPRDLRIFLSDIITRYIKNLTPMPQKIVEEFEKYPEYASARSLKGKPLVMYAVEVGNTNALKVLIENGADLEATDSEGMTPLQRAAQIGNPITINFLLSYRNNKASINGANAQGMTPLHFAVLSGNPEAVKVLLDRGANPNSTNSEGLTPLHVAAQSLANEQIFNLLSSAGANFMSKSAEGLKAEEYAEKRSPKLAHFIDTLERARIAKKFRLPDSGSNVGSVLVY
jgi:ankyrin repeat protein